MNLPTNKKYKIIYADPPWAYKDKALNRGGALLHYPVQNNEDLMRLNVKDIADQDCILFLWVTFPKINEVFSIIKCWGFEYKTIGFTWIKKNKKSGTNFWGMGRWTRANAEVCLICTKGNPKRISASVHSVIESVIERHSKKPDIVRDKIIELVGDLPRMELFAREKNEGWDCWGNEVE